MRDGYGSMTLARTALAAGRPPRPVSWLLLLASAAAVLVTGMVTTGVVFHQVGSLPIAQGRSSFWIWVMVATCLTVASLGLRALRWIFLLRSVEIRIPIRDAYIGYVAGLSLLLAPFLLGEIAVRAYVHRERGRVPVATTVLVNIWERALDGVALAAIAGAMAVMSGEASARSLALLIGVMATMVPAVRRAGLRAVETVARSPARMASPGELAEPGRLAGSDTWLVALAASVAAWVLPGLAFWGIVSVWGRPYGWLQAERAFASSTLAGGLVLAPGGIVMAGGRLLAALGRAGFPDSFAALSVVAIRFATTGLSTVLGCVFLLVHLRSASSASEHFDSIAEAYDIQIPEERRQALLRRKTDLMREVIVGHQVGRYGLDVGCGQGWYVARMRELGFDVTGIDASVGQVQLATRNVGMPGLITVGSVLDIPAVGSTYDFAYTINVVHHLASVDQQRAAFVELMRVLKPGGLLFLHEINTRNVLFRFYMGYVFPTVNCIDEGVERWLLPDRLAQYTDVTVIDIRYFTFLPDFIPPPLVRLCHPLERRLERSFLGPYAAHYMAVFQKAG
jgi:2-polyprenyl-3-methyl-5-hydroxy-6-metoxy-1,4-benzoquinol methylase/uncharacterized membrane protein YbhN (UPF0104 family)